MSEGKHARLFFGALLSCLVMLLVPRAGSCEPPGLSPETAACLECHGQGGITVIFENKEKTDAYVDTEKFKASVHASLGCSGCHTEFTKENHPRRSFKSKDQYAAKSSVVCRQCHPDDQLKAIPIHAGMLAQGGSVPACSGCHSPHAVMAAATSKTVASEKQHCLACHGHDLSMRLANGEKKSLKVDAKAMGASVHGTLACVDCHFGFSAREHPKRSFKTSRDFVLSHAEACRRCHFDKYTKTLESIHYAVQSHGNLNAPVCTDCHGFHAIASVRADRSPSAQRCGRCHAAVYETYRTSVHGKALEEQKITDVPVCVDCHAAHVIQDPRTMDYRERVPEICGRCHANEGLMKKYGLSTNVVKSYLQDFHGVTLKLYRQQKGADEASKKAIATCVDCHGVHDITKTTGPGTNLVKERLKKRCEKCHPGATEEFPDAWVSHYEPSLTKAPLVFLINLFYQIFIPFMIGGLLLQILLHVWRYAVNR